MRINHNISAMNTYRQLTANTSGTNKALEKLSSGLRINRAGDDAAGLAISEKMRGQIRGLEMATKNAQDGISLIQTAEGALNETHSILQRMRELAVQSSNDTNNDNDRAELQKEVDQLAQEITRIANNTEFNTRSLLNGAIDSNGVSQATLHIGANAGQSLTFSVGAMDAKSLGVARDVKSGALDSTNAAGVGSVNADGVSNKLADGAYTVTVASVGAGATVDAGTTGITGVTANGTPTADFSATFTYNDAVTGSGTSGAASVADGTVSNSATALGVARTSAMDSTYDGNYQIIMTDATNWQLQESDGAGGWSNVAGVTGTAGGAAVTYQGLDITLAAAAGGGAFAANDTFAFSYTGDVAANWTTSATSGATFSASYATSASSINANGTTIDLSAAAGMADGESITITGLATGGTTVQLFDTATTPAAIGSAVTINQANGGTYTIGNSTTGQMRVTFAAGQATAGGTTVTVSTDAATAAQFASNEKTADARASAGIDISTQTAASSAITAVQNAIESVSAERSKLGAVQNRLEHTINNLGASSENLTAAESRIRDVDMAKEMMEFTKNNILTQAAQAMLAQANQQPQGVLQLLR